jgi:copper chaperone
MQTEHLKVTGLSCGGCVSRVIGALKAVPGIGDVTLSLATGEARVQYDEHLSSPTKMIAAVNTAGYGVGTTRAVE